MSAPTEPRPRPAPGRSARVPARRPLAAGNIIVVMLVAALVGGLLNAAGIRKTAQSQPVGAKRDVARFFAEPLYDVSHTLRIDQLRRGLQAMVGRSGDDDIDTSLPDPIITTEPETAGAPPPTAPPAPARRSFSPSRRLTAWIGGDSLSVVPGQSFLNLAPGTEVIDIVGATVDGRIATGLARPEVFNWPTHIQGIIAAENPDAVVITLGSNDDQTLTGDGGVGPFGSPEWIAEYRRRVGGLMDLVTGDGKRVLFWMGAPVIRNEDRANNRYRLINDIYIEEARKRPGRVYYIDIYERFRDANGSYADILDGVQVRTADGIHFNRAGGDRIAQVVLDTMNQAFDLTSWRVPVTAPPATTPPTTGGPARATTP